jgi:hypothetical protein
MRTFYQYANLVDFMFFGNGVFRRCGLCRCRPVPRTAGSVLWCEPCVDEFLDGNLSLDEFVDGKRLAVPQGYGR